MLSDPALSSLPILFLLSAACQASLSFTVSWSSSKFMSIALVMPSNHGFTFPLTMHKGSFSPHPHQHLLFLVFLMRLCFPSWWYQPLGRVDPHSLWVVHARWVGLSESQGWMGSACASPAGCMCGSVCLP